MEELNKWNCLNFSSAARALGVSVWRVRYAVASGYVPPPSVVLRKRLLFSPGQVVEMKSYFEMEEAARVHARP